LVIDEGAVRGVITAAGEHIAADRVIIAGPPALLSRVAPEVAGQPELAPAQRLATSPIVNLHLRFDRPVLDAPVVAVWDSRLQWLFSRSQLRGERGPAETVVCSISAAADLVDRANDAILDELLEALHRAQPVARRARLRGWLVTRERHATGALVPHSAALRLGSATPVGGLALAGAWTSTGWPITMESAVRSGAAAVETLGTLPRLTGSRATVQAGGRRVWAAGTKVNSGAVA
jgi:hypothetical protein